MAVTTADPMLLGNDLAALTGNRSPTVETAGYSRSSLRDRHK
jgi:hypothetical protein